MKIYIAEDNTFSGAAQTLTNEWNSSSGKGDWGFYSADARIKLVQRDPSISV